MRKGSKLPTQGVVDRTARMAAKGAAAIQHAKASAIKEASKNARYKARTERIQAKMKGKNWRTVALATAAEETNRKAQEEETRRKISDNQRRISEKALEKWNGIIGGTPEAADGTGTGSQGNIKGAMEWLGNW